MKDKTNFTLTDLLICYAWNQGISQDFFARYLRDVCRIIRDNSQCLATIDICRRFIKLVKLGMKSEAINCLTLGYLEEYTRSTSKT